MTEYYVGQIFIDEYPDGADGWCENNNCYIDEIEPLDGHKRFEIKIVPQETAQQRKKRFLRTFFYIENYGYYRRKPKGYQSAVESFNTAKITCQVLHGLPDNTFIFYPEPDFTIPEQCSESWLVAHQIKLPAMTEAEFNNLYIAFVMAWNSEEH